jgi:NTP pyrophosphatase (non-canonical NTP hydrolase)
MLNELRDEIHENAINHGWWEEERSFGEIIALCHSELSEALEEYRNGANPNQVICENRDSLCKSLFIAGKKMRDCDECIAYKPGGIGIELADCIIRILDYCGHAKINIEDAIKIKHEYNKTRSYKHGGKKI